MGFCHAKIISPLNGDAPVVEVAGGGVAMLGEGVPAGVDTAGVPAAVNVAEAMKKFCLGGSLPRGLNSSYFHHWWPMAELLHLRDGILFEVMAVGDTNNCVTCNAVWGRVMAKKKECKTVVLAVLDAPNSRMLVCHRKAKGLATATKKKATIAKKAVEKQKAPSELRKVANPMGVHARSWFYH
jgi:hypothetical protein